MKFIETYKIKTMKFIETYVITLVVIIIIAIVFVISYQYYFLTLCYLDYYGL